MTEQINVEKTWGSEIWFANHELYCGKLLTVFKHQWSSKGKFHYHPVKDETFFVIEGTLLLHIRTRTNIKPIVLAPGESYRIKPGVEHKFTTRSVVCKFIEVSTEHFESDSIRVE